MMTKLEMYENTFKIRCEIVKHLNKQSLPVAELSKLIGISYGNILHNIKQISDFVEIESCSFVINYPRKLYIYKAIKQEYYCNNPYISKTDKEDIKEELKPGGRWVMLTKVNHSTKIESKYSKNFVSGSILSSNF